MRHLCRVLTLAAACASAFAVGCGPSDGARDLGTRAILVGIDSADWTIIDRLIEQGRMPNMARLQEQGVKGPLDTLNDITLSPVIWTSVATGKTPAKHGITWFMVDRPDGTRVPVRSHNRKVEAIWNILASHDGEAAVIGWWATYPAEDVGDGTIVSDAIGFHGFGRTARGDSREGKTHPEDLFEEVSVLVPPMQQISAEFTGRFIHISPEEYRQEMFDPGRFPRPNPMNPIHLFQQYAVTAQGYTAITERLLEDPYDLLMVYFEQVDSFSHLFMKYAEPKLDWVEEAPFERYKDVVTEWYQYQDELLGRLLDKIDLEETAVFVVSDHGFKSGERRIRSEDTVDMNKAHLDHERYGVFLAAGPHIRRGSRLGGASVLDLTPTLLYYLGLPVGQDMDGRVLETVFVDEFRQDTPIRYVTSHEPPADDDGPQVAQEELSAEELADTENALRSLGYLAGSPDDDASGTPAIEGGESSPEIHNNLGRIHLRNGEIDKARREFRAALELDPRNAEALLNLATLLSLEGRTREAERLVERALSVNPNSIGALAQMAELRRDQGDLDGAIRLFSEALAVNDAQPFLHLGYGDVLQRAGRYEEAERAFRHVLELDPDSFKAHYNLGVTYGNQGDQDRAIEEYEAALALGENHPEVAQAYNNLGAIHLDRGEIEQAQERFEEAVAASRSNLEARYNLALIYLETGRIEEAIELLEQAAAIEPNHQVVTVKLGMAYLGAGRGEDAYRSFMLVRRLYPDNWLALVGMAILQAANGQEENARRSMAEAIDLGGEAVRAEAMQYPILRELLEN